TIPPFVITTRDRCHETVAAARDIGDVARAVTAITQCLAQRRHMDTQAAFIHRNVGPHPFCQLLFADNGAGTLDQSDQHIHRSTAECDWLALLLEEPLAGV